MTDSGGRICDDRPMTRAVRLLDLLQFLRARRRATTAAEIAAALGIV